MSALGALLTWRQTRQQCCKSGSPSPAPQTLPVSPPSAQVYQSTPEQSHAVKRQAGKWIPAICLLMPRKWQPLQPPSPSQAYVQLWDVHVQIDLCSHLWRLEALLRASAAAWQCQVGMEHENTLRTEARSDSFSQSAGDIHLSTWQDFPSGITNHSDCAWRFYGSKIGEGGGEGRRREWEIRSQATEIPEEYSPLNQAVRFFS